MATQKKSLSLNKPELFVPAFSHGITNNAMGLSVNFSEVSDSNIDSTASFRYDPPGVGLRSTQQLNVDWSRFENHTFFNSAEVNVNVAFEKIINEYPFDGTKREIESFFDKLTGYEKHVYDSFPKNNGFLYFSGSTGPSPHVGTFIAVDDFAGTSVTSLSTNKSGKNVLDPNMSSFSLEMHLNPSTIANECQIICQKLSGSNHGFTLSLLSTSSLSQTELLFTVASGSATLNASASVSKGKFNHVMAVFDRSVSKNQLLLYVDNNVANRSSETYDIGKIDFTTSQFLIGSGTTYITSSDASWIPEQTFSGALDELRFFHSVRTDEQRKNYAHKSIFTNNDLRLYYKFNEPSGTLGLTTTDAFNRIVLDSSGNSLHGFINESGFKFSLRLTSSVDNPMVHEKHELSPILFPNSTSVVALNDKLMVTASLYDQQNPNLITKLVPPHYFQEGRAFEGLENVDGTIIDDFDTFSNTSLPGTVTLGSAQLLSTLLYVYAKFFDEMKIMLDSMSNILRVGYSNVDTTPDNFLPMLAEFYGFKLPGFFSDSAISQFIDAENLDHDINVGSVSLRYVQNQLMRRILTSLREIISSKGTLHSIKAFFRSMGIDPDNSMRIREFGGPTKTTLSVLREKKTDTTTMLSMTASNANIISPFLSGTKLEPELSFPASDFSHVKSTINKLLPGGLIKTEEAFVSPSRSDGLFTSGSWTYEAFYRFPVNIELTSATQSLVRLCTNGTGPITPGLITNLVAISASNDSRINLYFRSGDEESIDDSKLLELSLTGTNIFDGSKWHLSFGRNRADVIDSDVSSSYFLRAQKHEHGSTNQIAVTSSYFLESSLSSSNILQVASDTYNASGVFFAIGSQSLGDGLSTAGHRFLNASDLVGSEAREYAFDGHVGHIRFWSKGLNEKELSEHAKNFRSLGVDDPTTQFNFIKELSGSFNRLRIDASTDQPESDRSASSVGNIRIFDFSQNELHLTGEGFESFSTPIINEDFMIDHISTVLDEASTSEKIRIRGFSEFSNVQNSSIARLGPVYEIPKSEIPNDDTRFSIDFSAVDALDRDIINIMSALDEFDNAIGSPELLFSPDNPNLEILRDVYFNRLTDKINIRSFQDFFKWIDTSIGLFVTQLLPRKTKFLGMNFVVENHLLERPKFEYRFSDIYIGERLRLDPGVIFLQQVTGKLRRY